MGWVTFRSTCLILSFALVLAINLSNSSGIVLPVASVRDATYYECNVGGELDLQVMRSLETDGCHFRHGMWVNGTVHLTFDGDLDALNNQITMLHKCATKRVSVCFKPLRRYDSGLIDCAKLYWNVKHVPGTGTFAFTVDANSTTLCPDRVSNPTINRPSIDP